MFSSTEARSAILTILDEQYRIYQRLITVAEQEQQALLADDAQTLAPLVWEMEALAGAVERLERDRITHVQTLTGEPDGTRLTLRDLAHQFAGEERDRLESAGERLRAALVCLRALNDTNAALVRQAVTFADQWIRLLNTAVPATYAASGIVLNPPVQGRAWVA